MSAQSFIDYEKFYSQHIADLQSAGGDELRGTCPFCKKSDRKFYIAPSTGQHHCKQCDASGNHITFSRTLGNPETVRPTLRKIESPKPSMNIDRAHLKKFWDKEQREFQSQNASPTALRERLLAKGFTAESLKHIGYYERAEQVQLPDGVIAWQSFRGYLFAKYDAEGLCGFKHVAYIDNTNKPLAEAQYLIFHGKRKPESKEVSHLKKVKVEGKEKECDSSQHLFGAERLPEAKAAGRKVFVVEGELKAIALWQLGYDAVAVGGTAFKREFEPHLEGLDVILMPDSDAAGREALSKWIAACSSAKSVHALDLFPNNNLDGSKDEPNDIVEFLALHREKAGEAFTGELDRLTDCRAKSADASVKSDEPATAALLTVLQGKESQSPAASEKGIAKIVQVEQFLTPLYEFRHNLVTERTEFRKKPEAGQDAAAFETLTSHAFRSIQRLLSTNHLAASQEALDVLFGSDFVEGYHPFRAYLETLPEWDGETDYIGDFANIVTTEQQAVWADYFRRWLVAMMVSAAGRESKVNNQMLVLVGEQGRGKTTFLSAILPPELSSFCYHGKVDPDMKDSLEMLASKFIINVDELQSLTRGEDSALKSLITLPQVTYRAPYAHFSEVRPHRASFAGSINDRQFLRDTTGARRFLIADVVSIDLDALRRIDYRAMYSQALALYKQGLKYWFDGEDIASINERNAAYELASSEEDLIATHFAPAVKGEKDADFMTATSILSFLSEKYKSLKLNSNTLGKALTKLGFKRENSPSKTGRTKGYYVRFVTQQETEPALQRDASPF